MTTYIIEKNKVTFAGSNSVYFNYPVKDIVEVDNVLIVLLDVPGGDSEQRNVFGFDRLGDLLWRISNVKMYYNGNDCVYINITQNDKNEVVLFNWCDTAVIIDTQTGNVLNTYQTK